MKYLVLALLTVGQPAMGLPEHDPVPGGIALVALNTDRNAMFDGRLVMITESEEGYVISNTGEFKLDIGTVLVKVDPKYFRPTEVELLIGNPKKAFTKLGWKPKYDLAALVKEMMISDLELFKKDQFLKNNGYKTL